MKKNADGGCVYVIEHRASGKQYVGMTRQRPERRWQHHRWSATAPQCKRTYFRRALAKHGPEAFDWRVVWRGGAGFMPLVERALIARRKPAYNMSTGGESGSAGVPMSAHTKQRIREAIAGKPKTVEHRAALAESTRRRMADPAVRENLRQKGLGKTHSPAARQKVSAAAKGRKDSPETTERRKAAARKRWQNPEYRAKKAAQSKELWQDAEYREKVKQGLAGAR